MCRGPIFENGSENEFENEFENGFNNGFENGFEKVFQIEEEIEEEVEKGFGNASIKKTIKIKEVYKAILIDLMTPLRQ